ncbi:MAG: hypothetical protein AB7V43_13325 [Acidimicrobiia bacterium]
MTTHSRSSWRPDAVAALAPFLVARVLVAMAYVVALIVRDRVLIGHEEPEQLSYGLGAWDGAWYLKVAKWGYGGSPHETMRFFPLYPLLSEVIAFPARGHELLALVVVANVTAFAALVLLHRLVRERLDDVDLARTSVWAMALFPGAFVLSWAYAEPLLLVCSLACAIAAHRRAWWWAAAFAVLAAMSRPTGVLLGGFIITEVIGRWRHADGEERREMACAMFAPLVGLALVFAHSWWVDGEALAPLRVQEPLRGDLVDPVTRIVRAITDLFGEQRLADGLHAPFALFLVALAAVAVRKLPRSWAVLAVGGVCVALAADNLNSLERYGLNIFPIVVAAGWVVRRWRWIETPAIAAMAGATVALTALAWLGPYVP